MRYWFLQLEINCGEYEFIESSVQKTSGGESFNADTYASKYYDGESFSLTDKRVFFFNNGEVAVKVYGVKEITKEEYVLMRRFL